MANVAKQEYNDVLEQAAFDAATAQVKSWNRTNKELSPESQERMQASYYKENLRKLKAEYPFEEITRDQVSAIKSYDSAKMGHWLTYRGVPNKPEDALSPTEYVKSIKAADIFPILQGVAKEGQDWYTMGLSRLKEFGADHGYDVKTKEGLSALLKDIGEQQVNYDRAQISNEAREQMGWSYWPRKIIAPTAMQEFENAIMTGGDYDAGDAATLGALDAGINTLMWEAPGLFVGKTAPVANSALTAERGIPLTNNNIAQGVLGAFTQAGAEAGRQGAGVALSNNGQEFDVAPVLFAGAAGATKPSLIGTVQGSVSKIPGEQATEFARGVGKSMKMGDPTSREAARLMKSVDQYNSNVLSRNKTAQTYGDFYDKLFSGAIDPERVIDKIRNDGVDDKKFESTIRFFAKLGKNYRGMPSGNARDVIGKSFEEAKKRGIANMASNQTSYSIQPLQKISRSMAASNVPQRAEALGVAPEANGTYSAAKILEQYNKPISAIQSQKGGVVQFGRKADMDPEAFAQQAKDIDGHILDADTRETFRTLFPAKYQDDEAMTAWTKAGLGAGQFLGNLGGRAEPTFKVATNTAGVKLGLPEKTYKDEKWYKDMSVRSRKIIDEAFKKKEKETEEEE